LDKFFQTRIFDPLKMPDTYFYLPKEKSGRLAVVYAAQPGGGLKRAEGKGSQGQGEYVDGPRVALSSGGGLLSTARDYLRMVQLLVNGGELDGVRLLSPKTVDLMMTNHVGTSYENPGFGQLGFGYGFELTLDLARSPHLGSPGDFGYRSAYFTRYMGDPKENLSAIYLAQLSNYGGTSDLHYKWRSLVYQALIAPRQTTSASR
jgi:CubicO group peptidase (beta-lactamase class C family)